DAHALGEGVDLADPLHGSEQFVGDALGLVALGGQVEGAGRFGEDAGAVLDDSEVSHLLAGPHVNHLNSPRSVARSGRARNRHSRRYRACRAGVAVIHVNCRRSPSSLRTGGVRSGEASAVIEVSVPQTTGSRSAGKASWTSSCSVGRRTAR